MKFKPGQVWERNLPTPGKYYYKIERQLKNKEILGTMLIKLPTGPRVLCKFRMTAKYLKRLSRAEVWVLLQKEDECKKLFETMEATTSES